MKKILSAVAGVSVLAVAGWLGATWYTGKFIEADRAARLEETNQRFEQLWPGRGVKLQELDYERGFFSSRARYGLSVASDSRLAPGVAEIEVVAYHGPFPLGAPGPAGFAPKMAAVHAELGRTEGAKALFDAAAGKTPIHSDTAFAYGGDSQGILVVEPLNLTIEDRKVAFGGARLQAWHQRAEQTSRFDLQTQPVAVDGADLGQGTVSVLLAQRDDMLDVKMSPLVWKTGKGEGRLTMNMEMLPKAQPASGLARLNEALGRIKGLDAKAVLSKPMLGELGGRWLALTQNMRPEAADRQAARQIAGLSGMGQIMGLVRNEGDNLVSELRYADGKVALNGHEFDLAALLGRFPAQ
jgi:uncharacterized protein YdgA (DUF945 family)